MRIRASSHVFFLLRSDSLASPCPGHSCYPRCCFPALCLQNLLLQNLFLIPSCWQAGLLHTCSARHLHFTWNLLLFPVPFMWTASIILSQWSERTRGREMSNWSAAWIQDTQASSPYTVFDWFYLISQVPKFLSVTVSRSQLPQWLS